MRITRFREEYKNFVILVPLSKIKLTEQCHINAFNRGEEISEGHNDLLCVVRQEEGTNDNPQFSLLIGYRDYITAKNKGVDKINAIIVKSKSRSNFLKSIEGMPENWDISNVKEPKGWKFPNPLKIRFCEEKYRTTGNLGKEIIISPNGTIIDGYSAVCAARNLRLREIPVCVKTMKRKHYNRKVKMG